MNCFQLIKTVLDEAYCMIDGDDAEKDRKIQQELSTLSREYRNLLSKGSLDYIDPCRRFAYVYRYTTSHANLVYTVLNNSQVASGILDRDAVMAACIGGGPGSDFLGILKFCMLRRKNPKIRCHILDRDPAWGESWSDVDSKLGSSFSLSTNFQPFNALTPAGWRPYAKHLSADLFTLVYFMSELYAEQEKATEYFSELFSRMKSGAVLLYIDNNSDCFTDWFDGLASSNSLTTQESREGTFNLPFEEEKTDLQGYFSKFDSPKLQADIAYRGA